MKTLLTLPFLLLSLVSFPSWSETMGDLYVQNGVYYKKFSDVPFTGDVTGQIQGRLENGLKEGLWRYFFSSGSLDRKGEYKNGVREGVWVSYYTTGALWTKGEYKNGKREGRWVHYWSNGILVKGDSGVFKNDAKISD